MIGVEYVASEGRVIQKMGPLGRVYPYFLKGIMGGSSLFFTVVCASLFRYHIPVFFIVFLSFVPVLSIVTIAETL